MTPQTDKIIMLKLSELLLDDQTQLCVRYRVDSRISVNRHYLHGESGVIIPVQEINFNVARMHIRVGGS